MTYPPSAGKAKITLLLISYRIERFILFIYNENRCSMLISYRIESCYRNNQNDIPFITLISYRIERVVPSSSGEKFLVLC